MGRSIAYAAVCACLLVGSGTTVAQPDLDGDWRSIRHEDLPDRGPGVGLGDYAGIPLTDGARQFAESWDAAQLSMPQQQCRVHASPYSYRGPLNLRISAERDPRTQEVIAYKHYISTYEQTRTIWMDGRPHPPPYAPHTWMGFSTGRWQGDRLVIETTHIKNGWHRRNGVPMSDRATMTEYLVPHENTFTHIAVIRDPVYLTEPWVKTQHFEIMRRALPANAWLWPCTVVEEVDRDPNEVPHYLPGKNPYMADYRAEVHLDVPGVGGGAGTLLPEFARRVASEPATPANRPDAAAVPRRRVEQAPPRKPALATDPIETLQIRDNVYVLVGAGANTTVHVGLDGAVVVDAKLEGASEQLLAAIRALTPLPIRFVIDTHADADTMGGNQAVAAAGATRTGGVVVRTIGTGFTEAAAIVAHENVLARVSTPGSDERPQNAWPTDTFFGTRREFAVNGDGVELRHFPSAHTDGDIIVYFHRADVIAVGDLFSTETYPVIDVERGGSVQGLLTALNTIIELAIPDVDHEGGTMIVPSHGYLADEFDVAEYRDMVAIVRDRVQDMLARGLTRAEIQAARPTFDWDARYGAESGEWTTPKFVDAVITSLDGDAR
ncbi:MAG TPA: MBL fold metallo-hydrolase, partial [Gammaproteobacteria bacterium]|nr:MBL fold metallo-hydrolase [Gammaproteobacteria bacterium]